MRIFSTALAALASFAVPQMAHAATLDPAGDWQVETAPESCRLFRTFGSGAQAVIANFYAYGPDGSYRVTLTGANVPRNTGKARVWQVGFGDGEEPQAVVAINSRSGDSGMVSFHLSDEGATYRFYRGWEVSGWLNESTGGGPEPELVWPEDMSRLTLDSGETEEMVLNLGPMETPLLAMHECQAQLPLGWGFDEAALARIAIAPALLDSRDTMMQMSMPAAMVMNHVSVIAQLRMTVNEQGRATDCEVQSPVLEARATRDLCRPFMANARFEPAKDADGNAVAAPFRLHYTYFIFD